MGYLFQGDWTLKRGDKGEAVTQLQYMLLETGFDLPKFGADGDFGEETEIAYKKCQELLGVEQDGICTPKQLNELETVIRIYAEMTKYAHPKLIWDHLMSLIHNPFGVAGLMGNLYAESGLRSINLQGSFEKKLGLSDEGYTIAVDDGMYHEEDFFHDGAGYGLAQWTYWSRKQALFDYVDKRGFSIGNVYAQMNFLWEEISTQYKDVAKVLMETTSVKEASDIVLTEYERPANQSDTVKSKRASYGMQYYQMYADTVLVEPVEQTHDEYYELAQKVIAGLDLCIGDVICEKCPYLEYRTSTFACIETLMRDALKVLRGLVNGSEG